MYVCMFVCLWNLGSVAGVVDRVLEGRLGVQSPAEERNILFSRTPRATVGPTKMNYYLGNKAAGA